MKIKYIIITLILIVTIGCVTSPTGEVTSCPGVECRLTMVDATFDSKVTDDNGKGCLTDCNADVYVKNLEQQPTKVKVMADCYTVNKRNRYSSETYWMQPGEEHTFKIKVDAGMTEDWKCENFGIFSEKIYGCELVGN